MEKRDLIWIVGAAIYVIGMFPIFYLYQFQGDTSYGLTDAFSSLGAFLVMGYAFMAFLPQKREEKIPKK